MLRFATSPTGDMHIANLRVAILNYLVSQQKNDQFLVRIEDIDNKHNLEGKDTEIMMILEKFALIHNAVFHQSEHLNLYQTLALRLLKEEKAFICTCTDEILEANECTANCENLEAKDYTALKASADKFVIRLKKPQNNVSNIDAFIIVKTNGMPSYDFACATDDMMSNINFIIQEEKYLLNTPKQKYIKKLLGYEDFIEYVSIPSILKSEAFSVKWLFEEGFMPDAILNYLILLDNPQAPKEIFTLPEAIKWFDLNNISTTSLTFDISKLRYINREHLRLMDDKKLSTLFGFADADIGKLAK
ncbi:MAG: Glutamyl-tRNA(Gln) synthetase (EC, partial [uncultured Sulfurovum sp.]